MNRLPVDKSQGKLALTADQLAYNPPETWNAFKALTTDHTIVMGRKTFEALPKGALPNRRNIVITRKSNYKPAGCDVYNSTEDIIKETKPCEDIFVIAEERYTTRFYLTLIKYTLQLLTKGSVTQIHSFRS